MSSYRNSTARSRSGHVLLFEGQHLYLVYVGQLTRRAGSCCHGQQGLAVVCILGSQQYVDHTLLGGWPGPL